MNSLTAVLLILALLSMVVPFPGHRICVKAFIGSRMFNKRVMFDEVPRKGDLISIGKYQQRVDFVMWTRSPLVFLEQEQEDEAESKLIEAGFVELIKPKSKPE